MAIFKTDEIIKLAKMPPEAVSMSRYIDLVYFPILCILLVGTYHMHFMLLAGDWDFWLDWKDRQWWPVITPIVGILFHHHVLSLGKLPATIWRNTVCLLFAYW